MTRAMSRPERNVLLPATVTALAAGAMCVVVAASFAGGKGALSAGLATALVLLFLLVGQLPVAQASRGRQGVGAALLLGGYTARIALVLFAFRLFYVADGVDREVLGLTVVATALAWTVGAVWAFLRWRPLYVEPDHAEPDHAEPDAEDRSEAR